MKPKRQNDNFKMYSDLKCKKIQIQTSLTLRQCTSHPNKNKQITFNLSYTKTNT